MTEKVTKAQAIYDALLGDIEGGRLLPGLALDEVQVARSYGVSRTPVREAIRRLEVTGLVEARSHRGAVVIGLNEQKLDDMFAVMAELEALCAKWAALGMTTDERRRFERLHLGTRLLVDHHDAAAYTIANTDFHEALYKGAHNEYLSDLVRTTRRRAAPFRTAQFQGVGRLARSFEEHQLIVDAVLNRNADEAYARMREHLVLVRTAVDAVVSTDGD